MNLKRPTSFTQLKKIFNPPPPRLQAVPLTDRGALAEALNDMAIFSYFLVFVCGVIAGMCLAGLLASARHNIDETPVNKRKHRARRPTTPEDFRPSMHDEEYDN